MKSNRYPERLIFFQELEGSLSEPGLPGLKFGGSQEQQTLGFTRYQPGAEVAPRHSTEQCDK